MTLATLRADMEARAQVLKQELTAIKAALKAMDDAMPCREGYEQYVSCDERILALARAREGRVFTPLDVQSATSFTPAYIASVLTRLVQHGHLIRVARGRYCTPDASPSNHAPADAVAQ
jgi:hypothetical protein